MSEPLGGKLSEMLCRAVYSELGQEALENIWQIRINLEHVPNLDWIAVKSVRISRRKGRQSRKRTRAPNLDSRVSGQERPRAK